jgi:hypothetical protein
MALKYVERQRERGIGIWWRFNRLGWHWDSCEQRQRIYNFSFELYIACYWSVRFLWGWEISSGDI